MPSGPLGEGCPCRNRAAEFVDPSVSPESTEFIILPLMGDGVGWVLALRCGSDCSFDGGIGGCSGSGIEAFSPSGPRGPRESSTDSNLVACAPTRRGVRGPLPTGDLGVEDSVRDVVWEEVGLFSGSARQLSTTGRHVLRERRLPGVSDLPTLSRFANELDLEGTSSRRG